MTWRVRGEISPLDDQVGASDALALNGDKCYGAVAVS
jgi:hypothetical protein